MVLNLTSIDEPSTPKGETVVVRKQLIPVIRSLLVQSEVYKEDLRRRIILMDNGENKSIYEEFKKRYAELRDTIIILNELLPKV